MRFLILSFLTMSLLAQKPDYSTGLKNQPFADSRTPQNWGALADNVHDDTSAIQSCLNYGIANRAGCTIPPGLYKISGAVALTISASAASLLGMQSLGNAAPCFVYSGTGTALNITNGASLIYGVNLTNICILAANNTTGSIGINVNMLSGGDWQGVTVGGIGNGKFTTNISFKDTGLLTIRRLTLNNPTYSSSTTGILFDNFVNYGNDEIYIETGDLSNIEHLFDFKSCSNCVVRDTYMENMDYFVWIDNTVAWSANSGMSGLLFDGNKFSTVGVGPSNHKILKVTSTTGNLLNAGNLVFNNNQMYLGVLGGVTYPFQLNVSSMGANSNIKLTLNNNNIPGGVNTAVVDANSLTAQIIFGPNFIYDATGTGTRPSNFHGTGTVVDFQPENLNHRPLNWLDPSGEQFLSGTYTNAMSRPSVGVGVSGVISGADIGSPLNSNGFLRVGVANVATYNSYCDFFGFNTSAVLDRTMTCFIQDTQIFKLDANGMHIGKLNTLSETGANNAIVSPSDPSNPTLASGLTVTVILAHTLQAGANTFAYNGGTALAIKSSLNGANNIATAYAVGGIIVLFYNGSYWQDVKQ